MAGEVNGLAAYAEIRRKSPLILALDMPSLEAARKISGQVRAQVDIVKVGLELFSSEGPDAVKELKRDGFEVFLDVKMCDIPNTVASACKVLAALEPLMVTVYTMGGQEMMRAAEAALREHCSENSLRKPVLIGVTVLTSFDLLALKKIGVNKPVDEQVTRLARLAASSGLGGLVTSPLEILRVRREVGDDMILIAPGVRLGGDDVDDQKRVGTPGEAIRAGADFLVVGRPISRADDPSVAARAILEDARSR